MVTHCVLTSSVSAVSRRNNKRASADEQWQRELIHMCMAFPTWTLVLEWKAAPWWCADTPLHAGMGTDTSLWPLGQDTQLAGSLLCEVCMICAASSDMIDGFGDSKFPIKVYVTVWVLWLWQVAKGCILSLTRYVRDRFQPVRRSRCTSLHLEILQIENMPNVNSFGNTYEVIIWVI